MSTDTGIVMPPAFAPPPHVAPAPPPAPPIIISGLFHIPRGIGNLETFRDWVRSMECPGRARLAWLAGTLWVDLTMEQLYTHNQVKGAVGAGVWNLVTASGQGRYLPDGMMLSNTAAELCTVPDGLFVSYATLQSGRLRQVAGKYTGVVELEGTPDMVLEVVSDSSVAKDTGDLPELYRKAGIPEFWRIDARGPEARFEILRLTETGYVAAQEPDGWWRSAVFNCSFKLMQQADPLGQPQFTLAVRP